MYIKLLSPIMCASHMVMLQLALLSMQIVAQDEVISWVRRRSNAFARGKSKFRGVSGRVGRWETRIGSFSGLKNVSLSCSLHLLSQQCFLKDEEDKLNNHCTSSCPVMTDTVSWLAGVVWGA